MQTQLSILIPVYNDVCVPLVKSLYEQATAISDLTFEIVVADDGTQDESIVSVNSTINNYANCRYIIRQDNVGRAAIRNFLASEAQYDWLLFVDSGVRVTKNNFIKAYIEVLDEYDVVCGGVEAGLDESVSNGKECLRYIYEKACEPSHDATHRTANPYKCFRTTNFLIRKNVFSANPLDASIKGYGYEDVLFGKVLSAQAVNIKHIDNAVTYYEYEDNALFLRKTEESLRTLSIVSENIGNWSRLLKLYVILRDVHVDGLVHIVLKPFMGKMSANLVSSKPSLLVYNVYKMAYLIGIMRNSYSAKSRVEEEIEQI